MLSLVKPPLALLGFRPLEHGEIGGVALLHQRREVFEPCVLVENRLRPLALMLLEHTLDFFIRKRTGGAKPLIHRFHLVKERRAHILPQHRLLTVEYVRAAFGRVDVLQIIAEYQRALIVDADGGVEVVRQKNDLFFHSATSPPMNDGNIFLARESTMRNSSVKRS